MRILTKKDVKDANVGIPFIINDILNNIKKEYNVDSVCANPDLIFETKVKVLFSNLFLCFEYLIKNLRYDPFVQFIFLENRDILKLFNSLFIKFKKDEKFIIKSGKTKSLKKFSALNLKNFVDFCREWQKIISELLRLPLDNSYLHDVYHPAFYSGYKFKPDFLPEDYRSNQFFEAKIKEFNPVTNLIGAHPFSDFQITAQEKRSFKDLIKVDVNVDFTDIESIEKVDNIRGFRAFGPDDNTKFPGSFIVLCAGHHRIRELFVRFIKREIPGDTKILIQLVGKEMCPNKNIIRTLNTVVNKREIIRAQLNDFSF